MDKLNALSIGVAAAILDRRTGVRRQDALRQPRPGCWPGGSQRLRAHLEPARLSGLRSLRPRADSGAGALFSLLFFLRPIHPPAPR